MLSQSCTAVNGSCSIFHDSSSKIAVVGQRSVHRNTLKVGSKGYSYNVVVFSIYKSSIHFMKYLESRKKKHEVLAPLPHNADILIYIFLLYKIHIQINVDFCTLICFHLYQKGNTFLCHQRKT